MEKVIAKIGLVLARAPKSAHTDWIEEAGLIEPGSAKDDGKGRLDHPGLNPVSERIVELQYDIRQKLGALMPNKSAQKVLEASEALHGESNNIAFPEHLLKDLQQNGVGVKPIKMRWI
ncbi:hypothetical protein RND71_015922 [Anisodus tanguticus]|uniref:Uncharacterized protein n=1 Tax=Anisodus tanguticus TaxID=243964 RepID=A0AAE1S7R9_9SOLA|nr:hypothetical protein RND71_015922 [Anisodus tanguticus]